MKLNIALNGQSPEIPLDLILQALASSAFSGFLGAAAKGGLTFTVTFWRGRIVSAVSDEGGSVVDVLRRLLAVPTVWACSPERVRMQSCADVTGLLLEVARVNDEAHVLAGGCCGC